MHAVTFGPLTTSEHLSIKALAIETDTKCFSVCSMHCLFHFLKFGGTIVWALVKHIQLFPSKLNNTFPFDAAAIRLWFASGQKVVCLRQLKWLSNYAFTHLTLVIRSRDFGIIQFSWIWQLEKALETPKYRSNFSMSITICNKLLNCFIFLSNIRWRLICCCFIQAIAATNCKTKVNKKQNIKINHHLMMMQTREMVCIDTRVNGHGSHICLVM